MLLRLDFADFWPGFDKHDNWFVDILSRRYQVVITPQPQLVIYSCFGQQFRAYDCLRVFVNWENRGWSLSDCDYAFTSDLVTDPRHYRLPLWVLHLDENDCATDEPKEVLANKSGFANVVVSNPAGATRNRFWERLETYRPVASGGQFRNNVGGPVSDKHTFTSKYKFNIAFENSSYPGYTTEKLLHALQAGTVPIYWGDPEVGRDFNTRRFVNCHEYATEEELIDRIIELDQDDSKYLSMLDEPWFCGGHAPRWATAEAILDRFDLMLATRRRPVAQRRNPLLHVERLADRWRKRRRYRTRAS